MVPRVRISLPVLAAALLLGRLAPAGEPPKVVKATPDNGDAGVDPGLTEIRVEFDRDMSQSGHSICGGGEEFPEVTGKVRWINLRTLVIPVKLQADHRYHLGINCPAATNFRSASGEAVEPYPISFRTGRGPAVPGSGAPKVDKAIPDNGDTGVDPGLTEIRVEFDRNMSQTGHSICGGGEEFPEVSGRVRWANRRTAVIPVKLKPDHQYRLSINCPAATNFRSASGEAVEPYPISFRTAPGRPVGDKGKARAGALQANRAAVKELERAIDESYSYRDLHQVDWAKLFKERGPTLEKAATPAAFAREAATLLAKAEDLHIWLKVDGQTIGTYRKPVSPNFNLEVLAGAVSGWKKRSPAIYTGKLDGGMGYVLITTWAPGTPAELEPAFEALDEFRDAGGLVVDVRPNGGGDEVLARDFAGCFVSKPSIYSRNDYRDRSSGSFSKVLDRLVEPKKGRPAYRGKVAVLIGPANMSSCESFILMMRCAEQCRLFGERTRGSSGNPKPTELANGVTVYLPSWRDKYPDGTLLEGNGIQPDVVIKADAKELSRKDPVLEAALEWLRKRE